MLLGTFDIILLISNTIRIFFCYVRLSNNYTIVFISVNLLYVFFVVVVFFVPMCYCMCLQVTFKVLGTEYAALVRRAVKSGSSYSDIGY